LAVLLAHFATIDDPRDVRRISHPLAEILLLVVCGTIADCDDYDHVAAWGGKTHEETRCYISSAALDAERAGQAVRGHWGIENRLHWVLDVTFNDDQSACAMASEHETWPSSATSPSTSCGPQRTPGPSNFAARWLPGRQPTWNRCLPSASPKHSRPWMGGSRACIPRRPRLTERFARVR
jgi:hypothetical protein